MKALRPGDAVVVTKLDRVARSSRDLHNILGKLKDLGCGFVSLGEGWCDTTSSVGRLVISIMAGIAEFERELIRARCQAGIDRAKAKGTGGPCSPGADVKGNSGGSAGASSPPRPQPPPPYFDFSASRERCSTSSATRSCNSAIRSRSRLVRSSIV